MVAPAILHFQQSRKSFDHHGLRARAGGAARARACVRAQLPRGRVQGRAGHAAVPALAAAAAADAARRAARRGAQRHVADLAALRAAHGRLAVRVSGVHVVCSADTRARGRRHGADPRATSLCVVFDIVARIYQEPQLLVLLTLCVFNSWLWKSCLYAITTGDDASVGGYFSTFVWISGIVSFLSFMMLEKSIVDDPFVLDPRAALLNGLQRDFVRAVRRGVIVWSITRVLLVLGVSDVSLFSLQFARAYFQITSSVVENFVWFGTASVFRILLFRGNHKALENVAADGSLWDSLDKSAQHGGVSIEDLFAGDLAVDAQANTPLNEQYVVALRHRVDRALAQISSRKVKGSSFALENVEALDTLFKYGNLMLVSKFSRSARKVVFSSEKRWNLLFQSATAVIDSFTLSLQLLNTIPERKNQGDEKLVASLEKSFPNLVKFVLSKVDINPLLLLDEHPHLANVRISPSGFKNKIHYYIDSRAQLAVRRFLIEESRRRVFLRSKVVYASQELLCHLVSISRVEDSQGTVQHTVPAVLSSLVECRKALDSYLETCLKNGLATDIYMKEANALAIGIDKGIYRITDAFYGELSSFSFSPEVKDALNAYVTFNA
ncbi:Dynein heavy chain, partial [Globisporangium splendens]